MLNVYPESRAAGLRCVSLQMPALTIGLSHSSAFALQYKGTHCSAPVPRSFIPSTCYKEHRLQTQFRTVSASALTRITWSLLSQCSTWQPQCTVDDQSLHSSQSNLPKHTSTGFFLPYHLIWSCSQCHLIVQIKTMVKAAQERYKAEAGFPEWDHLIL